MFDLVLLLVVIVGFVFSVVSIAKSFKHTSYQQDSLKIFKTLAIMKERAFQAYINKILKKP